MEWLEGKKTYLAAVGFGVVAVVWRLGWIDDATFKMLLSLLVGGATAAMRQALAKQATPLVLVEDRPPLVVTDAPPPVQVPTAVMVPEKPPAYPGHF